MCIFKKDLENFKKRIFLFIKSILVIFVSIIFIGSVYYLPMLLGPTSFLPGSLSAFPEDILYWGALPIWNILTLKAYPDYLMWNAVKTFYGINVYEIWEILLIILIILILFGFIIFNDKRLLYLSMFVFFISMFASEMDNPIPGFRYIILLLYENMIGYQATNYPYLWVWFSIVPLYSIMISIIVSDIYEPNNNYVLFKNYNILNKKIKIKNFFKKIEKFRYILPFFIIFILLVPISTQAYYSSSNNSSGNGIQEMKILPYFITLANTLNNLTKVSNGGVIFNTPNSFIFFGNDTKNATWNIAQSENYYRTVDISSYLPNYNTVTDFYYWFYHLFYTNGTKYSAKILAMLGVEYFVDVYNAYSVGYPYFVPWAYNINASKLIEKQEGWIKIISTSNYSIFKNTYFNGNDYYTNNFTLILGDYNTINSLAYLNINLTNLSPIFSTDILTFNSTTISLIMDHVNLLVFDGNNSYYDLILNCYKPGLIIFPINYINGVKTGKNYWINSERSYNWPYDGVTLPYVETGSQSNLTIPININSSGNYTLFFKAYFSNSYTKGGILKIIVNDNLTLTVNTSKPFNDEINKFIWVNFPVYLHKGKNILNFESMNGFNAIQEISVVSKSNLEKAMDQAKLFLLEKRNNLMVIYNPNTIAATENSSYHSNNLGQVYPGGYYLYLSSKIKGAGFKLNLPMKLNGTLLINLSSDAYFTLNISLNKNYYIMGLSPGIYVPYNEAKTGYSLIKIKNSTNINISIYFGNAVFGSIVFFSGDLLYLNPFYKNILKENIGNISYIYYPPVKGISNFKINVQNKGNYMEIKGNFTYQNISSWAPITIGFSGFYDYNMSPAIISNVNGPAFIFMNGVCLENSNLSNPFLNDSIIISPNLNVQVKQRPNIIQIQILPYISGIVPFNFNDNGKYNVSFTLYFYGFINYSNIIIHNISNTTNGPIIENNMLGYAIKNAHEGFIVVRYPYSNDFKSNVILGEVYNGLCFFVYLKHDEKIVDIYVQIFYVFILSLSISIIYSTIFIAIPIVLNRNKNFYVKYIFKIKKIIKR
jgi:hypothetical protein